MKKKKLWILVIGIAVVASLALMVFSDRGTEAAVTDVKRGDIKKYVEEIGTVKCKELKTVSIEGSGLIQSIAAEAGQPVKKGELLLTMEKKQLEIQLKNVEQQIKEIEASFQGSEVKNYASNMEKARIAAEQAKEAYRQASEDFNNVRVLAEAGAASSDELKKMEKALSSAQAMMDTSNIDLQQIQDNTPESIKAVYRAKLEQVFLSRESILHSLEKQEVRSPMDGVVLERKAEVNTLGVPGTIAFIIGNVEEVELEANILADDVTNIRPGNRVEITERSEEKQVIGGKVIKIAPSAVAVTSSLGVNQKKVSVTIEPEGHIELLRHGYEVDLKVVTESKSDVLLVPLSAVFDYKDKDCIFVIVGGKAVLRAIHTGIQDESYIEIVGGLKEGELVLSEPDISIKEGMRIKLPKPVE